MDPPPDGGWKADSLIFPIYLPKCAKPRDLAAPGLRTGEQVVRNRLSRGGRFVRCTTSFPRQFSWSLPGSVAIRDVPLPGGTFLRRGRSGSIAREQDQSRACYPVAPGMDSKARDLMAPDTEPTDEELALVMREARDLAIQRRATADAWVAARLREASAFARASSQAQRADKQR